MLQRIVLYSYALSFVAFSSALQSIKQQFYFPQNFPSIKPFIFSPFYSLPSFGLRLRGVNGQASVNSNGCQNNAQNCDPVFLSAWYVFFTTVGDWNVGGLIIYVGNVYRVEDLKLSIFEGILTHFSTKYELKNGL